MTRSQKQIINNREPFQLIQKMLSSQINKSKQRGHEPPDYNYEQLEEWIFSQPNVLEIMLFWRLSGYDKDLKPSIDRINNDTGYSIDNIQLGTWEQNNNNGSIARRIPIKLEKDGKTWEFDSLVRASWELGIVYSTLKAHYKGRLTHAGGYEIKR